MQAARGGEPHCAHRRQERVFYQDRQWYFRVRGGHIIGPYGTKRAAVWAAAQYVEQQLEQWAGAEAPSVVA